MLGPGLFAAGIAQTVGGPTVMAHRSLPVNDPRLCCQTPRDAPLGSLLPFRRPSDGELIGTRPLAEVADEFSEGFSSYVR